MQVVFMAGHPRQLSHGGLPEKKKDAAQCRLRLMLERAGDCAAFAGYLLCHSTGLAKSPVDGRTAGKIFGTNRQHLATPVVALLDDGLANDS
jgi:hypothetical protein